MFEKRGLLILVMHVRSLKKYPFEKVVFGFLYLLGKPQLQQPLLEIRPPQRVGKLVLSQYTIKSRLCSSVYILFRQLFMSCKDGCLCYPHYHRMLEILATTAAMGAPVKCI